VFHVALTDCRKERGLAIIVEYVNLGSITTFSPFFLSLLNHQANKVSTRVVVHSLENRGAACIVSNFNARTDVNSQSKKHFQNVEVAFFNSMME